ncbi:thioesterase II family protein, partial [Brenneria goodwinii]
MEKINKSKWLVYKKNIDKSYRLYFFPYSGGNVSSFIKWQDLLHPDVELYGIQLPGHGSHYPEKLYYDMEKLITAMIPLFQCIDKPFAFWGHSLGGLLSYQVCQRLQKKPEFLIISGCKSISKFCATGRKNFSDDEIIDILKRYGGTPKEVLKNSELLSLYIPIIRADFQLIENFHWVRQPPISIPMLLLSGKEDIDNNREKALAWGAETTREITYREFPGGHFFINNNEQEIASY